jgi:hypothetical protein
MDACSVTVKLLKRPITAPPMAAMRKRAELAAEGGKSAGAHLVFEAAQQVGAGAKKRVENRQDAGRDGSI